MKPADKPFSVRFTTRGRLTIPAAVRRQFGITGCSQVTFKSTPDGLLLKPVTKQR